MLKKILSILFLTACILPFSSCKDDEETLDPSLSQPVIKFAYDDLQADMNEVDNLPVVAVIRSELGLKKVIMQIETETGMIDYKTVTTFFNEKAYSLSENLNYQEDYKAFVVTAIDKLNREAKATLELGVTGIKEGPSIVFDPESITYDELVGGDMPKTHFTVTSVAGLQKIEMYLVSESGQMQYGFPIEFDNAETEYVFDEQIMYMEGDKGFKVKATDVYGQVKIVTMTVNYLTPAPPTITLKEDTVFADKDETKAITLRMESQRGIRNVKIYRIEDSQEVLAATKDFADSPLSVTESLDVLLTNATSKLKIVATDVVDKTSEATMTAIVNMDFVANLSVGSQILANGNANYPDVYALISLKDMKTYSVDYALESSDNASNVDLKFYAYGGQGVLRMYAIDGGNDTKCSEFKGKNGSVADMEVQNKTRLLAVPGFDFDNATAESISNAISASNITSNKINPFVVGDIIAFKTADPSTAGGGRIGVMKILSDTQVVSNNPTARIITVSIKLPKK